jgi:hemerythrin
MQPHHVQRLPKLHCEAAALSDIRAQHRNVFLLVRRLYCHRRVQHSGAALLTQYERIVEGAHASFAAEEQLLRALDHPTYQEHLAAHSRIADGLIDLRHALVNGVPISYAGLLHSLDALVIHHATADALFERLGVRSTPATAVSSAKTEYTATEWSRLRSLWLQAPMHSRTPKHT